MAIECPACLPLILLVTMDIACWWAYRLGAQVVLAALLQDGNAFQFADLSLRGDREFVLHLGPIIGVQKMQGVLNFIVSTRRLTVITNCH